MHKKVLFLFLLLLLSACDAKKESRFTDGGYDMRRYIINDTPNLRDCNKFDEIPKSEIIKYIKKYPKYQEVINNNQRTCYALLVQTLEMNSNSKTQDIWFGYAQKLLLVEKKPLLKEECNILYKPMMQYVYDSISEKSLVKIQKKLTQCIKIVDKKYNLKYLLGEVNRVLKSKGVTSTLIQK